MITPSDPAAPLGRYRPFVLFWFARVSASLALQMMVVAVGWQVYSMTGSALDLGLVGLAQFVPAFLLVLVAGAVADRYDRSRVVRLAQLTEGSAALMLAIGTWQGFLTRDLILALVFVLGAGRAFEAPTLQALLPRLVPLPVLPRAVAGSASANQAATIAGPAIGGMLYVVSPTLVYALCAALFVGASHSGGADPGRAGRAEAREDRLRHAVRRHRFHPQEPADPRRHLARHVRGTVRGRDRAAADLCQGRLPCRALGARHHARHAGGRRAPDGDCARALAAAHAMPAARCMSRSRCSASRPWCSRYRLRFRCRCVALFAIGAADMVSVVVRQTLVQLQTPDAMLGRVISVNALFVGTSNQLGEFDRRSRISRRVAVLSGAATLIVSALDEAVSQL